MIKTLISEYDNRRPSKKQIDINQVVWISHYRYIVEYRYYHVVCSNEKRMIDVSCYYKKKKKKKKHARNRSLSIQAFLLPTKCVHYAKSRSNLCNPLLTFYFFNQTNCTNEVRHENKSCIYVPILRYISAFVHLSIHQRQCIYVHLQIFLPHSEQIRNASEPGLVHWMHFRSTANLKSPFPGRQLEFKL
jgi:hypothetical protein